MSLDVFPFFVTVFTQICIKPLSTNPQFAYAQAVFTHIVLNTGGLYVILKAPNIKDVP